MIGNFIHATNAHTKEYMKTYYRLLLLKYMRHVAEQEGLTFVSDGFEKPDFITDEEWIELLSLSEQCQED